MPLADVLHTFRQYGPVHVAVVLAIVAAGVQLVRRRRRLADEPARRRLDVTLGAAVLTIWAANQVAEMMPWRFELHRSLPLHVCDVVGLVAALAMLTGARVWRAMLYYWGIGLSTQALITPELADGLATFSFWSFWVPHGAIIALAVYDLAGRGYRPGWRDFAIGIATLTAYLAVVLPFDLAYQVNYGFVGRGMPGQPSVIDFLGDWPIRVYKLAVAVFVVLAVLTVPWVVAARRAGGRRELPSRGPESSPHGQGGGPLPPRRSPIESLESRTAP